MFSFLLDRVLTQYLISAVADLADVARYGEGAGGGVEAVHALVILRLPGLLRLVAAGARTGARAGGSLVGVLTTGTWNKRKLHWTLNKKSSKPTKYSFKSKFQTNVQFLQN